MLHLGLLSMCSLDMYFMYVYRVQNTLTCYTWLCARMAASNNFRKPAIENWIYYFENISMIAIGNDLNFTTSFEEASYRRLNPQNLWTRLCGQSVNPGSIYAWGALHGGCLMLKIGEVHLKNKLQAEIDNSQNVLNKITTQRNIYLWRGRTLVLSKLEYLNPVHFISLTLLLK